MTSLTYKFGNNFENEKSSVAITVPALIEANKGRGSIPPIYVVSGEEYQSVSIPENCVISNMYLVVEAPMAGTVTVSIDGTDVFTDEPIATIGAITSSVVTGEFPLYTTTPQAVSFVFNTDQTAGSIKLAFDFIQLDTNTAKYVGR